MPSFKKVIEGVKNPFLGDVFAFDPGETTGFAHLKGDRLIRTDQLNTKTVKDTVIAIETFRDEFTSYLLGLEAGEYKGVNFAIEDYRIYSHKSDTHKWSNVHTIKVVGLLEALAESLGCKYKLRMASEAKNFVTDDYLKDWGFWRSGERHARDAIRHGIMQILFP